MANESREFVPGPKIKNEDPPLITYVDGPSAQRSEQKRNLFKEALSRLLGKHKVEKPPVADEPKAEVTPQIVNKKTGQAVNVAVGMEKLPKAERERLLGIESAELAQEGAEPAPAKPLTLAQIKHAELQKRITEAGSESGLRVVLEGGLETWHTKINRWLIKTENVPSPMSVRERLTEIARGAFDPSGQDNMPEDFRRQAVDVARVNLRVAEKLVTSLRLRLGGPYPKG